MMKFHYSNAPCSWGVEFVDAPNNPSWENVLDEIAAAGYQATELGPYGYLPLDVELLRKELVKRKLSIIAGTLFQHLHKIEFRQEILAITKKTCKLLQDLEAPFLVIIDHVSSPRTDQAGQVQTAKRLPLKEWKTMMRMIDECASVCIDYGILPVLHAHTGSYIEYEDELEKAVNDLNPDKVKLCIDTGHCYYADMDPADTIRRYGDRIAYMHFKDIDSGVHNRVIQESTDFYTAVSQGIFCPLGHGSIDFKDVYKALAEIHYQGWITIEQDDDPLSNKTPLENAKKSLDFVGSYTL